MAASKGPSFAYEATPSSAAWLRGARVQQDGGSASIGYECGEEEAAKVQSPLAGRGLEACITFTG
jgi:hypothetical protein